MVHIVPATYSSTGPHVGLTHFICDERVSEEQIQKDFDAADPGAERWSIAAVEGRHRNCYEPPLKPGRARKHKQLSLTLLRSCRQIYLEANMVHYKDNTFAIDRSKVLEHFAKDRHQHKQHLAIRRLYLNFIVVHASNIDAWSEAIDETLLKHFEAVRFLHLNLAQHYCMCGMDIWMYEGSKMAERQREVFKKLGKLSLKEATFVIDDGGLWNPSNVCPPDRDLQQWYRWTVEQKKEFSKEIRGALLGGGKDKEEKGT